MKDLFPASFELADGACEPKAGPRRRSAGRKVETTLAVSVVRSLLARRSEADLSGRFGRSIRRAGLTTGFGRNASGQIA